VLEPPVGPPVKDIVCQTFCKELGALALPPKAVSKLANKFVLG